MANSVSDALNRIADAIFAQVKAQKAAVKVSEEMLAMQKVNLSVTKALEESLTRKTEAMPVNPDYVPFESHDA